MVHVGWFRPLVTKLLPSTINRFGTSCARWYLSTTELLGSFPIRQVPMRCPAAVVSSMGNAHFLPAPAAKWALPIEDTTRSEEHTSELQSLRHLVCRLLLEKKKKTHQTHSERVK